MSVEIEPCVPAYDMASLSNTLELSPDQTYSCDVDVDGDSEDLVYGYDVMSLSRAARLDNLVKLDNLNEESIVEAIRSRYMESVIYTYVGDMLLATNPFKHLPIYGDRQKALFHPLQPVNAQPHIFAIAQKAFKNMSQLCESQCCLISGESGAGKTETAKLFLNHLLNFEGSSTSVLERRILESQPLLEAFGNAKTVLNDNSSRFGKFIEIFFSHNRVCGANIERYLLEKSRLVGQQDNENSFHIFYYLLTGAPATVQQGLGLMEATRYNYLHAGAHLVEQQAAINEAKPRRRSSKYDMPGTANVSDVVKYEELIETMSVLEFDDEEISEVHAILAAVLNLGNIDFVEADEDNGKGCKFFSGAPMRQFCRLFRVRTSQVTSLLNTASITTRGEKFVRQLGCRDSRANRDSIAMSIYQALFKWLVDKINRRLAPHPSIENMYEIGVLDIFGFENFKENGFEQLCINTANEQLQYFFTQHIFRWEIEEYKSEGIQVDGITFQDNQNQVTMLLGRPIGIFTLLDEECRLRDGSDSSFLAKLNKNFSKKTAFVKDKLNPKLFGVLHYAGLINYDTSGIVDRNRDTDIGEFTAVVESSSSEFIRQLFDQSTHHPEISKRGVGPERVARSFKHASGRKKEKARAAQTVGASFKASLGNLMLKLEAATPHYIRCIKPNINQESNCFDSAIVVQQLRYTGVMETTNIRSQGFAIRIKFEDFIRQYRVIKFRYTDKVKVNGYFCSEILAASGLDGWQIGKSKVFLKYHHRTALVEKMERYSNCALIIGMAFKCYKAKNILFGLRQERRLREIEEAAEAVVEAELIENERLADLARQDEEKRIKSALRAAGALSPEPEVGETVSASDDIVANGESDAMNQEAEHDMIDKEESFQSIEIAEAEDTFEELSPESKAATIVKGTDVHQEKHGTLTKVNVGARLAMFQNAIAGNSPEAKHQTLTRGVNVGNAAKSMKIDHKRMLPKNLKAGPAMPGIMPWRQKLAEKKSFRFNVGNIPEERSEESAGVHTLLRNRGDLTSFLAELSLTRLYGELVVEAGIEHPEDFKLFSEEELVELGFKLAHVKKVMNAIQFGI